MLVDTGRAVRDFRPMLEVVSRMTNLAQQASPRYSKQEVEEVVAFLRWLREGNFVFLGAREYEVTPSPDGPMVQAVPGSGLGILSDVEPIASRQAHSAFGSVLGAGRNGSSKDR